MLYNKCQYKTAVFQGLKHSKHMKIFLFIINSILSYHYQKKERRMMSTLLRHFKYMQQLRMI